MMTTTDTPRIYVASLSDYNAGTLHGRWIDADQDADDIQAEVDEMLAESPENKLCQMCGYEETHENHGSSSETWQQMGKTRHPFFPGNAEEWAIHDYENFHGWKPSEWESFETIATVAAAMEEFDAGAVGVYLSYLGTDDPSGFEDAYHGHYDSEQDYAMEYAEETGAMKDDLVWPFTYIDWDRAAAELFCEMTAIDDPTGGVWVFSGI